MTRRRLVIAVVLVLALCATMGYVRLLPARLFDQPLSPVILERRGELLGARLAQAGQGRLPAGEALPQHFVRALIEYEDNRFYSHLGVDPWALGRAAYLDLKARRIVSGGSTLTMQVARLARAREDRGVLDKLIEMMLAT